MLGSVRVFLFLSSETSGGQLCHDKLTLMPVGRRGRHSCIISDYVSTGKRAGNNERDMTPSLSSLNDFLSCR